MKQLYTILLLLPSMIIAQSIEIVSQPTTFASSGTAYAPSEGQPPYIMRFKGYNITPNAGSGELFVPIKETSAVQNDVSAATLSASGDQTNKNGAATAGNSGTQYGTVSGVHGAVLGNATAAAANARLLNYTDNGDDTYDVDVVINRWSEGQTIPNDTSITPTARFFSDGTKVGIPVIEDSNNAGTYVVAGATFDNSTLADIGENLITKATAILTDLDDTDDLVLNSGFDNVNKHWYGNHGTIEVRTENGNSFFFADVTAAGEAYAVNLQQKINITQFEHYILTFEASTDDTTASRTIVAGIGKVGGDFASVTENITLTDTPQVFEINFNPRFDVGDEQRVFFDLGADAGIVVIDDVSLRVNENPPVAAAPTDAPTPPPTRDAADVVSIYGEAYGTAVGLNSVDWDSGSYTTEETIAGNAVLKTTFSSFIGFDLASEIDASEMTHMHLDIWISDAYSAGQVFKPTFSNWGGDGSAETDKFDYNYEVVANDSQSWVSLDLPFSDFTTLGGSGADGRANLKQLLISVAATLDIVYLDNIYLYKDASASIDDANAFFAIYPNPVQNTLNVSAGAAVDSVSIFDITGREVLRATPNTAAFSLDVATLNKGLYLVTLKAGDQEMTTKLVK